MARTDGLAGRPTSAGVSPGAGGRWQRLVRLVVAGLVLAVVVVVLAGQWGQARPLLGRLSVPVVAAAWGAVLAGIYASFRSWRAALAALGGRLPHAGAMRVFYLGQLGKYVPGSVWPALTQMRLGRDYRVPVRASGAAFGVFMLVLVGTGLLVGLVVVPVVGGDVVAPYRWGVLVLAVVVLALVPPVLNRVLAVALHLLGRPPLPAPLSLGGVLGVVGWALGSWGCYGVQVYLLAWGLGVEGGVGGWLAGTGAFAAAFVSGLLVVASPAGAGVREAALVVLLGATVTVPVAAVIAVVSRLLFIAGDLAWSAIAMAATRRVLSPPGPPAPP